MNFVESTTWATLQTYLAAYDPDRTGWAIDVGIGDDDYYFEWLSRLGYQTVAVEPLPTEKALRALEESRVRLVEAALASIDGEATLYTARGIHSLHVGLWGAAEDRHAVRTMAWESLLEECGIDRIAVLKLDIEGGEYGVIRQLRPEVLPAILSFEFGGVWDQHTERGPWSEARVGMLIATFAMLEVLGYRDAVMISSGAQDRIVPTTIAELRDGAWIDPECNWGNIVTRLEEWT